MQSVWKSASFVAQCLKKVKIFVAQCLLHVQDRGETFVAPCLVKWKFLLPSVWKSKCGKKVLSRVQIKIKIWFASYRGMPIRKLFFSKVVETNICFEDCVSPICLPRRKQIETKRRESCCYRNVVCKQTNGFDWDHTELPRRELLFWEEWANICVRFASITQRMRTSCKYVEICVSPICLPRIVANYHRNGVIE